MNKDISQKENTFTLEPSNQFITWNSSSSLTIDTDLVFYNSDEPNITELGQNIGTASIDCRFVQFAWTGSDFNGWHFNTVILILKLGFKIGSLLKVQNYRHLWNLPKWTVSCLSNKVWKQWSVVWKLDLKLEMYLLREFALVGSGQEEIRPNFSGWQFHWAANMEATYFYGKTKLSPARILHIFTRDSFTNLTKICWNMVSWKASKSK